MKFISIFSAISLLTVCQLVSAQPVDDSQVIKPSDKQLIEMTRLLRMRLGTDDVDPPKETNAEGVYETLLGDKFAYLVDNGRFLFIGEMIDLEQGNNLTEISRRNLNTDKIEQLPKENMVIFPANIAERVVLNVFTDTSCGYCRKLHEEVKYLQNAGITVRYIPYPRGGNRGPGYEGLKQVWCSKDKTLAMSIAKGTASGKLGSANCAQAVAVDEGYALGNTLGVTGTPALFTSDGEKVDGYVPHQELIRMLVQNI